MGHPAYNNTCGGCYMHRFQQFHELLIKHEWRPHVRWALLATLQHLMSSGHEDAMLDSAMDGFNQVGFGDGMRMDCLING